MGRMHILALALLAALAVSALVAPGSEGSGDADGLLIYEINPKGEYEGVSVFNYGASAVDMADYSLYDGYGYITFSGKLIVEPGQRATFCSKASADDQFSGRDRVYTSGTAGVTVDGKFELSNSGDRVYLLLGDAVVDAVCYGSKTVDDPSLWSGRSVPVPASGFIQRIGAFDSDSADDWSVYMPGKTYFPFDPDRKYGADVTPFTFPESGGIPVYRALESATKTVDISIYLISSGNVYGLLAELEGRGVEVRLLLEGNPVSPKITDFLSQIRAVADAGAEVRLINAGDADSRYNFAHAKYAVIDGSTVVVTSENWAVANMNGKITKDPYSSKNNGNRGWGAVVKSAGYSDFMEEVFENDFDTSYGDTVDFLEKYPNSKPVTLTYTSPSQSGDFKTYHTEVVPVLSSDSSYEAMRYYISNCTERAYSQNQSLTSYYANLGESSPVMMMADRAHDGVDCRFMLSSEATDAENQIMLINSSTLVKAATMSTPYLHNKGMVLDDVAWVSSINWTPTSVEKNRECGVAILSGEIADYFAGFFLADFERYYSYDGISVDISEIKSSYRSGEEATFSVTVKPIGTYTYVWDLGDGSDPLTSSIPRIAAKPADGAHVLKVTVSDDKGHVKTVSKDYSVVDEGDSQSGPWLYLAPVIALIAAVAAVLRRHR